MRDAFEGRRAGPAQAPRRVECRFRHRDGSWRLLEVVATDLLADPVAAGIVLNAR